MSAVLPGQLTVDEFILRPERDDGFREELIEGEIVVSPNTKKRHTDVARRIGRKLARLEDFGFIVFGEVACQVSSISLPNTDVAVFRKERWEAVDPDDFSHEAPALAVEIVSPGNRLRKLMTKVDLYLEHGSEQVWLVYPTSKKVIVYLPGNEQKEVRAGELLEFYGVSFDVATLSENS